MDLINDDDFEDYEFDDLRDEDLENIDHNIFNDFEEHEDSENDFEYDFFQNVSFDEDVSAPQFEPGESSGLQTFEKEEEIKIHEEVDTEVVVDDLTVFIEMCQNGYDDSDMEFPPGFEPGDDYVLIQDWVDSDDEIHPEGKTEEKDEDNYHGGFWIDSDEEQEPEQRHPWWFPKVSEPKKLATKRFFKIPTFEYTGRIISWKYDNDNKVFIIKRTDGLQYLRRSFKELGKIPKCEVNHIAQVRVINHSGHGMVNWMSEALFHEQFKGAYTRVKEVFPRRVVDYFDIEPNSNQPRATLVYPRVKCLKKIPLERLPINFSKYISYWRYNGSTGEAEIGCYDRDYRGEIILNRETIVYVFDPLSLINLSRNDLEALAQKPIIYDDGFDDRDMALKYQRVVDVCCAQGVHAGGNLPR